MQIVHYDFYGCRIKEESPPILEVGIFGIAEGFIEIITPGIIHPYTIDTEVHRCTHKDTRVHKCGINLSNGEILFVSHELLHSGNLRIFYRFDPFKLYYPRVDDYYMISFFINRHMSTPVVRVFTAVIIHIVNKYKEA